MQSAWIAIIAYHVGTVAGLIARPAALQKLRSGFHPWLAGVAIPLGIGTFWIVRWLLPWVIGIDADQLWMGMPGRLAAMGLSGGLLTVFAVYFVTVHPVLEDLAWRGVLGDEATLKKRCAHDLCFAIYHVPVLLYMFPGAWLLAGISFVVLVGASVLWRQIANRTGGIQSVILHHAAADAGILAAVLWPRG
jgi:membrane protease YdiL (CAAX protease family)